MTTQFVFWHCLRKIDRERVSNETLILKWMRMEKETYKEREKRREHET